MVKQVLLLTVLAGILAGCGGSSSGSSSGSGSASSSGSGASAGSGGTSTGSGTGSSTDEVEGLEMPSSMSIVSAQGESTTTSNKPSFAKASNKVSLPGSDYDQDPVNTYVFDDSMESLGTVNMILCIMEQTAASELVNEGAYIALVNEDKCEQGAQQSSDTGQSSGANVSEYNTWVVESTRADDASPQVVKMWVPGDEGPERDPMDAQTILVEVSVDEGVSDANPFGQFTMNFKGVVDASAFGGPAGFEVETMRGTLQTVENQSGQPQYRFINVGGVDAGVSDAGFGFTEAVNVLMSNAAGTSGQAITSTQRSHEHAGSVFTEGADYAVAFDEDHLLRGVDSTGNSTVDEQTCLARDSFDTAVWRYNLYHENGGTYNGAEVTAGQRVEINGGFPFEWDSDGDSVDDSYGWMGYHGVWADGQTLADGTVVTRYDYSNDTSEDITLNVSAGKAIYRSSNTANLSDFIGDEFRFFGQHPGYSEYYGEWIITVVEGNAFIITGLMEWTDSGPVVSDSFDHDYDSTTPEVIAAADMFFNDGENLWFWSEALGGDVVYVHDSTLAAAERTVTFYGREFLDPAHALFANGALTLYCYERCLKGGLTQQEVDLATSDYDLYHSYQGSPLTYELTSANGKVTLMDLSNNAEVSTVGLDLSAIGYDWGINTGEMLISPLATPDEPWRVFDESHSIHFETGNNEWNRLVTATDVTGQVLRFDRPLQFVYSHSTANDANGSAEQNGKTFLLNYSGIGDLHGFPWVEDEESGRWYSAVTLADGTVLESNAGTGFLVKGMEKEQTMQHVDLADCDALEVSTLLTDASFALPTPSDISDVSFDLGDRPDVDDAPRVIEGVLQD